MTIKRFLTLALLLAGSLSVAAQEPSIVGTWILTGADKLLPDGTRIADYGPSPHGLAVFTADGYYSVQIYRAERVKFASGDKFKGTPEEYKDASLGMSDHFGRYSVDPAKGTITFHIDRSSVPNIDDTTQVRAFEVNGDTLSWKVPARKDGSIPITTLRRASAQITARIPLPPSQNPSNADLPISAAAWAGDTLYVSGWLDPDMKTHTDTTSQTVGILKDIQKFLESQNLTLGDVVMVRVYLGADPAKGGKMDFDGMMAGYRQFFGTKELPNKPARTTLQVTLPSGARGGLVEIDVVAVRPK